MSRNEFMKRVTEIFHDVFDDTSIVLNDSTSADDIEGWDSLSHITLISEIEVAFGIRFSMEDIIRMKNVGEMLDILTFAKERSDSLTNEV